MPEFIMNNLPLSIFIAYIVLISVVSVIVCFYDKKISKLNKVGLRTPEKWLLVLSALGGSVAMLICMFITRHKTKHIKFMVGIPVIIILQIAAPVLIHFFVIPLF